MASYDLAKQYLNEIRLNGDLSKAPLLCGEMDAICKAGDKKHAFDIWVNALFAVDQAGGDTTAMQSGYDAIVRNGFDTVGCLLSLFKASAAQTAPMRDLAEARGAELAHLRSQLDAANSAAATSDEARHLAEQKLLIANQTIAALEIAAAATVPE